MNEQPTGKVHFVDFTADPMDYLNSPHVFSYMHELNWGLCKHGDLRKERMTMDESKVTCKHCRRILNRMNVFKDTQ